MLRIADLEFAIESCRLQAFCREESMIWDIEVECYPHPCGQFHRHGPTLSLSLFQTPPNAIRRWTELPPRSAQWVEPNDTDVTPSGSLYIFEHTPIYGCHAHLTADAAGVRIALDGKCNVHYDEEYDAGLDLRLSSLVTFRGVPFGRRPEPECRAKISRFLDPNEFDFSLTEHGVSLLTPKRTAR